MGRSWPRGLGTFRMHREAAHHQKAQPGGLPALGTNEAIRVPFLAHRLEHVACDGRLAAAAHISLDHRQTLLVVH